MLQLIDAGAVDYARSDPVDQANLACALAAQIMACRTVGHREETPETPACVDPSSFAAREGPPELERARQREDLPQYLLSRDPALIEDVMGGCDQQLPCACVFL